MRAVKKRFGPDGVHLFDRRTGWNFLFDSQQPASQLWARGPRQVSIALTDRCDLQCPHCYAPKTRNRLPAQTLNGWLQELDEAGTLGVGFGGGEPTLYPNFVEVCKFAAQETGLAVTFTSHGHHLDDELIEQLRGVVHFFRLSVDGVGAVYERMRGRPFHRLEDALKRARRLAPFGLNMVVNETNVHQLQDVAALAEAAGASELLLLPMQATETLAAADRATLRAAAEWTQAYRGPLRLAVSEAGAAPFTVVEPLASESGLRAYAHIDARGHVRENSFSARSVEISRAGVLQALEELAETA